MRVYGDPQSARRTSELVTELRKSLAAARDIDEIRSGLIAAGQMEQALADAADPATALAEHLTDAWGRLFVAHWIASANEVHATLRREIDCSLDQVSSRCREQTVTVKIPEGYAFYALFPEQYCTAAIQWAEHEGRAGDVLVVGIRSIGTSLSAVVCAMLQKRGFVCRRMTLRPVGPPFERTVQIDRGTVDQALRVLIVDEGPGLSGSSMAAVARELHRLGIDKQRLTFFPGHSGSPGAAATEEIHEWWRTVPRRVAPLAEVRWEGLSLHSHLVERTERLLGSPVSQVVDFSGGKWREHVFPHPANYPPVVAPFERMKLWIATDSGEALLWKWEGIHPDGTPSALLRQRELSKAGWCIEPLDAASGFVATRWIKASRPVEPTTDLLAHVARYITATMGSMLNRNEAAAAIERLAAMMSCNLGEFFHGEEAAAADLCRLPPVHPSTPSYGDGRMAPHEWLLLSDHRVLKTDAAGHAHDHTCIGPQSWLWDVAGVIIEWRLAPADRRDFLQQFPATATTGIEFYESAYLAWKLGLQVFCMAAAPEQDRARLRDAISETASLLRARRNGFPRRT
jgi:hypothetical protein